MGKFSAVTGGCCCNSVLPVHFCLQWVFVCQVFIALSLGKCFRLFKRNVIELHKADQLFVCFF